MTQELAVNQRLSIAFSLSFLAGGLVGCVCEDDVLFDPEEGMEIAYCAELCEALVEDGAHRDEDLCLFECLEEGPDYVRGEDGDGGGPDDGEDEPPPPDTDGDGLSDDYEGERGTDPGNADSDGDGDSDGEEVDCGSSPLDPNFTCENPPASSPSPDADGDDDNGGSDDAGDGACQCPQG